jgi:hypothetical protein
VSLYRSELRKISNAAVWGGDALISDINYAKFTVDAKMELHGCSTAENPKDADNIASDLSERLFAAGKTKTVVIGHTEHSEAKIKGAHTQNSEQDYRYANRAIYRNGKLIKETLQPGALNETELAK